MTMPMRCRPQTGCIIRVIQSRLGLTGVGGYSLDTAETRKRASRVCGAALDLRVRRSSQI